MRISLTSCLLIFCRCAGTPPPLQPHRVDVPWPSQKSVPKRVRLASDLDNKDYGTPHVVLKEGHVAEKEALEYALSPRSTPDTINRLAELSRQLAAAREQMDEHYRIQGFYSVGDVKAVERALKRLRDAAHEKETGE